MSIRVACRHLTHYKFDRPVNLSPHTLRLRPAPHSRTPIRAYAMRIAPDTHFINWQQDPFGNYLARLVFPEKTRELQIEVEVVADMTVINPFDFFIEEYAEKIPFNYEKQLRNELAPYFEVVDVEPGPRIIKKDPEDDKFIRCALAGKAKWIISGDRQLLALKTYQNVKILTPSDFLQKVVR